MCIRTRRIDHLFATRLRDEEVFDLQDEVIFRF